ncbi:MAG: hypothetical protein JWP57_714 [Spirosoma sp.]|nr:hypothetical protein [Spirosoma sp.]
MFVFALPTMSGHAVTRLINVQIMLTFSLVQWLIAYFDPEANLGLWLGASFGSFMLRLLIPKLTIRQHLSGWTVGFIAACLMGRSIYNNWLGGMEEFAVWGLVGFLADLLLQILVYLISFVRDHPAEAFDNSLERVEKVATVWTKVKEPLISLADFIIKRFKS